jgi:hypothetical protein
MQRQKGVLRDVHLNPFTGKCTKALNFLSDFNSYWICNDNNVSIKVPYHKVAICLGFFEGNKICKWNDDQARQLQEKVQKGMDRQDEDLWNDFKGSFINTFVDTAAREHTTTNSIALNRRETK